MKMLDNCIHRCWDSEGRCPQSSDLCAHYYADIDQHNTPVGDNLGDDDNSWSYILIVVAIVLLCISIGLRCYRRQQIRRRLREIQARQNNLIIQQNQPYIVQEPQAPIYRPEDDPNNYNNYNQGYNQGYNPPNPNYQPNNNYPPNNQPRNMPGQIQNQNPYA